MQKVFASVLSLAVAVGAYQTADAALLMNVSSVEANGNVTYTLNFKSDAGLVAGFVGNETGAVGINGAILQQKVGGAIFTPTQDLNAAINPALDSQFLFTSGQVIAVTAPFETDTTMGGAFTIAAANRVADFNMLKVVAPIGHAPIPYNFGISEAIGSDAVTTNFQGFLGVPEPATFAMAGLGLVGLVAASRRRQA